MKREEWQKLISSCQSDEDFKKSIGMAYNDVQTDALGKTFYKNGTPEIIHARLDARRHRKYKTGWNKVDACAMPRAGKLTLIPAYTHHGKSVLSMNMAWNIYREYKDTHIVYYSFESDLDDISLFFSRLQYWNDIEKPTRAEPITQSDWDIQTSDKNSSLHAKYKSYVDEWSKRIFIRDDRISPAQLDAHIRSLIDMDHNVGVIFIDYLQDMKIHERTGEHHADIEQMAIDVERIASEYGVAIIVPAQYKRPDSYHTVSKKTLIGEHRLFGSSGLSKKADLIYSLYNDTIFEYQFNNVQCIGEYEELEIDILKARKQNYARNLTLKFNRRTGEITESERCVFEKEKDVSNAK